MINCPLILTSAVDERGESFDAPTRELTEELREGTVRGGRRGRRLVNYESELEERLRKRFSVLLLVIQSVFFVVMKLLWV